MTLTMDRGSLLIPHTTGRCRPFLFRARRCIHCGRRHGPSYCSFQSQLLFEPGSPSRSDFSSNLVAVTNFPNRVLSRSKSWCNRERKSSKLRDCSSSPRRWKKKDTTVVGWSQHGPSVMSFSIDSMIVDPPVPGPPV